MPENQGDSPESFERWTAKRRSALVVSILKGETTAAEAARQHGLTVAEVEAWKEKALAGMENALRSKPKDEEALQQEYTKKLERKVGQMALEVDVLREAMKPYRPFAQGTSDE